MTDLWDDPPDVTARQGDPDLLRAIDEALAKALGPAADRALLRRLRPLLLASLVAAAEKVASDLGIEATIDIASPIAKQYFRDRIPNLRGVNRFTKRRIRRVVAEEIAKGSPLGRQIRRLRQEFRLFRRGRAGPRGPSRARTVARTENGIAWGVGQHAQMVEAGVLAEIWITARDLRVRESHEDLEGDCALINERFDNGLLHPLDPAGPPDEVINCRCAAAPAPRGCKEARLATYRMRTRHWRAIIAQQRPHERALIRAMRAEWLKQERDVVAAFRAAS